MKKELEKKFNNLIIIIKVIHKNIKQKQFFFEITNFITFVNQLIVLKIIIKKKSGYIRKNTYFKKDNL